jgi:hypothetical protein
MEGMVYRVVGIDILIRMNITLVSPHYTPSSFFHEAKFIPKYKKSKMMIELKVVRIRAISEIIFLSTTRRNMLIAITRARILPTSIIVSRIGVIVSEVAVASGSKRIIVTATSTLRHKNVLCFHEIRFASIRLHFLFVN